MGKQATVSAAAYTLYLKAMGGIVDGPDRIRRLDEAIALDPNFALAYAMKARTMANLMRFGLLRGSEQEQIVLNYAEKALSIDPDLIEPHLALATSMNLTGDA